jgi:hypothetical protein
MDPEMKNDVSGDAAQSDQEAMGGLPPTVAALARNAAARAAEKKTFFHPDPNGELYRKAGQLNMGEVKTNEEAIAFGGKTYAVQGFENGILVAEDGQWNAVTQIPWGTTKDATEGGKTVGADQVLGGEVVSGNDALGGKPD